MLNNNDGKTLEIKFNGLENNKKFVVELISFIDSGDPLDYEKMHYLNKEFGNIAELVEYFKEHQETKNLKVNIISYRYIE